MQGDQTDVPGGSGPGVSTQALTKQTLWAYTRNWPVFHKKPENKHVWLCGPRGFSSNYSTLPLWRGKTATAEGK